MNRKTRFFSPFVLATNLGLGLGLSLLSGACDNSALPWPKENAEQKSNSCQPGPHPQTPKKNQPAQDQPESPNPSETSTDAPKGAQSSSNAGSTTSTEPPLELSLWEFLYNPKGTDGAAQSPEVVDLLVTGPADTQGPISFELQGQGWSPLTAENLSAPSPFIMPVGSLLRIERYKNQSELDKANQLFPQLQVRDPKTGRLAVQILRSTGAGLRNKGGWLLLRNADSASAQGVIYGDIDPQKVDSELQRQWEGPFAKAAPDGQALCKIPDNKEGVRGPAQWWTVCQPSSWGRPQS